MPGHPNFITLKVGEEIVNLRLRKILNADHAVNDVPTRNLSPNCDYSNTSLGSLSSTTSPFFKLTKYALLF